MNLRDVVIIDDEAWTRDTIRRIGRWQEYGFRIAGEASDGLSGLECIRELSPQLIITDMRMPGLDGAKMLEILERRESTAKIIIVSGYTDFSYTKQALSSRAIDYLLKPIDPREFNEALSRCAVLLYQEQRAEELSEPTSILQLVNKDWFEQYRQLRELIGQSLQTLTRTGIQQALHQLEGLYEECDQEKMLPILIRMSHDLYSILEEHLISTGSKATSLLLNFAVGEQRTIGELCDHYSQLMARVIDEGVSENQRRHRVDIRPIKRYIEEHYQENISLEQLAQLYSISKEYLSTRFRKEYSMTFSEYLVSLRMERARELIIDYGVPLKKIPELIGYIDTPHFYKVFKRYYGITPGAMRDGQDS